MVMGHETTYLKEERKRRTSSQLALRDRVHGEDLPRLLHSLRMVLSKAVASLDLGRGTPSFCLEAASPSQLPPHPRVLPPLGLPAAFSVVIPNVE